MTLNLIDIFKVVLPRKKCRSDWIGSAMSDQADNGFYILNIEERLSGHCQYHNSLLPIFSNFLNLLLMCNEAYAERLNVWLLARISCKVNPTFSQQPKV